MSDNIYIDDYSFLETDNNLYLMFPAYSDNCGNARILYNAKNTIILQRNSKILVFQDIPTNIRKVLNSIKSITIAEIAKDNKTLVRGYELELEINTKIPNIDHISEDFDNDFSFLKELLSDAEYKKYKKETGF